MSRGLTTNQKNCCSEVSSYSMQQQQTISQLDCDMQQKADFIQPAMTNSVVWLRRSSQALPKAKSPTKKGSWSLLHDLLPLWSTTAFWIPVKPLHLRSLLSKSIRCAKNCNACSWQINRQNPILLHENAWLQVAKQTLQKLNELGLTSFARFTRPLVNQLPLLQASHQLFAGKMLP